MSRSTRTLIAIVLWLLAGFIVINNIIQSADLSGWLLPIILFVAGLILTLYPEGQAVVSVDHAHEPTPVAPPAPKPALEEPAPAPVVEPEPTPAPVESEHVAAEMEPEQVEEVPAAEMIAEGAPLPEAEEPDDLTTITGIGPKMRDALHAAGITTYAKLATSSEDELRAAIEAAGMRLSRNLDTWPAQARAMIDG